VIVPIVSAFRKALAEAGFVEGKSVAIEFRWAEGRYERLPDLAMELVGLRPVLIVTGGGGHLRWPPKEQP
jgi:putative tryptophan/tyrosine transport system substrate-binding protein